MIECLNKDEVKQRQPKLADFLAGLAQGQGEYTMLFRAMENLMV